MTVLRQFALVYRGGGTLSREGGTLSRGDIATACHSDKCPMRAHVAI